MSANHLSVSPVEDHAQPIELGWSSERLPLHDKGEDWTGITSPAERRKLQNRLNQRARRERARKRNPREATAVAKTPSSQDRTRFSASVVVGRTAGAQPPHGLEKPVKVDAKGLRSQRCMASVPQVQALMRRFADHAYASYMQGAPAVAHLPLLVRYNVSTALATNAGLLGVTEEFYMWDGVSPMNKQGPLLGSTFHNHFDDWPATLQPTELQLSTEHHPWVDCFPWPKLRDNLLKAFEHPDLCDEDELCHDLCNYEDAEKDPMLFIWGSPCDARSWELSEEFLKKWAWLLNGCGDMIVATNHWRAKRGETMITPQQFANWMRLSLPRRLSPSGT